MNIFRVFNTILCSLFIYLLLFSRRNLVESSDTSAVASQSYGPGAVLSNKTGVDLSLKATSAKNEFNYNKSGRVVTFTAKDNYGFKSVKTGDTVVWSTTNASEYATKVVLNGKGQKKKTVTIHLPNNITKVFNRDSKGKPWNEVTQESSQTTGQPGSGTNSSVSTNQTSGRDGSKVTTPPAGGASKSGEEPAHGANESTDGTSHLGGGTDGSAHAGGRGTGGTTHTSHHGGASPTGSRNADGSSDRDGGSPPANEGSRTDKGGEKNEEAEEGSQSSSPAKGGNDTHKSNDDGSPVTTPPANTNEGQASTNPPENGGSSPTLPANPGGDRSAQGGGASPPDNGGSGISASQTNDLMEKFDKLVGQNLDPSKYPNDIKLFKADPNDATKTVGLNTSEYKVKNHGDENLYVFDHGVNCTLLKREEEDVWKYDPSKADAKYPKGMNVEKELVFIYFDGYTEAYSKRSNGWALCMRSNKDLSSLKVIGDDPKKKSN